MCKELKVLSLTILLSAFFITSVGAEETTDINSLIDNVETINNQTVTVEGEAIGEVMERGEYAWVNINDGTNAIGIWIKVSDAETITYFGDNKHIGDTVRITGTFSRDCTEHGGDVDIHCSSIEIIKNGYTLNDEVSNAKAIVAVTLCCTALLIAFMHFRVNKKEKR